MTTPPALHLCLLATALLAKPLSAQNLVGPAAPDTTSTYSSSLPEDETAPSSQVRPIDSVRRTGNKPFHSVAFAAKGGVNGIGFDVATPIQSHLNLRSGAQFFSHDLNPNADGIHSFGQLTLQNVQASLDIFPFRHNSFHLSPGVTIHNDNHLFSSLFVPGGTTFSLGDTDYISDPNAPITGSARVKLGNELAPRLTLGWGNMIPRNGGHFSVPIELGFQYISSPTLALQLYGNACDNMGDCGDINASDGPQNVQSEVQELNQDISKLRFYPIVSIGFSYKFGH